MTPEAETILLNKITQVMRDLHEHGTEDGEAMFMLGAGADHVCKTGQAPTWAALKSRLSDTETLGLLAQIDVEGQAAVAKDQVKQAYALQILGLSVAAIGAQSPQIRTAAGLMDDLIATALGNYRKHASKGATPLN
ncbi:hypothetical protein [Devosia sp.]|uniref:hypothetical protein n=1 Tax=Devosia sp. TaxID=1871048 RepID=UPI001A0A1C7B|nr:hypothetical protein [Devosia sp.]MBE0580565.1 hypothetical protein [Devosia sp.]